MEEQFIPYKQALDLKELGFDEDCLSYFLCKNTAFGIDFKVTTQLIDLLPYDSSSCKAPLWQQAFDWFRKRGYYFEIYPDNQQFILEAKEWYYIIKKGVVCTNDIKYYSYKEARLACLEKLIELCKEKKF